MAVIEVALNPVKCIRPSAQSVVLNVKSHSNQLRVDPYTVESALLRGEGKLTGYWKFPSLEFFYIII